MALLSLFLLQLVGALTLGPWLVIAAFSFMAFLVPGASKKLWPYLLVSGVVSYPVVVAVCFLKAWSSFHQGDPTRAFLLSAAPLAIAMAGYLLLVIVRK